MSPKAEKGKTYKGSVKVMRSYDYCHFECSLSSDEQMTLDEINGMRKAAAVLVDEAVRQYKIAKQKESGRDSSEYELTTNLEKAKRLEKIKESELTPEQAAFLRSVASAEFWKNWDEEQSYYYQEEMSREEHFSMLRKFQNAKVRP